MYTCSCGTLVASAILSLVVDGVTTTVAVSKGDELTDIVMAGAREDRTIEKATVRGFILGPKHVQRGYGRVYDGISTYNYDQEGDAHFGLAEEVYAVNKVLVEIPSEVEGGRPTVTALVVGNMKSLSGGTPVVGNAGNGEVSGSEAGATE